ncbi:MAG: YIP1 family protein, partial [Actinomycetia bacterium]|nr:YIP1 family protein [Actinomycetes bacterium]
IYSGAVYGVSRYLFEGHGTYAPVLRITGFAYPTVLIIIFANLFVSSPALVLVIGGAWFVVVVANGMSYVADLAIEKAFGAAIGGYVLLVIVQTILSSLRIF